MSSPVRCRTPGFWPGPRARTAQTPFTALSGSRALIPALLPLDPFGYFSHMTAMPLLVVDLPIFLPVLGLKRWTGLAFPFSRPVRMGLFLGAPARMAALLARR